MDCRLAANTGTLWAIVSSAPASINNTCQLGLADKRLAKTHPAGPDPTIIKSYSESGTWPEGKQECVRVNGREVEYK